MRTSLVFLALASVGLAVSGCRMPDDLSAWAPEEAAPARPREAASNRLAAGASSPRPPHRVLSFDTAKRHLRDEVYADHRTEAYCGCPYDARGEIDRAACGYVPRGHSRRTRRIEWEHQVPAARFGQGLPCWRGCPGGDRGRTCCAHGPDHGGDARFREMLGDMHNLVPAVGELNEDRSDRPYGEVRGEVRAYGSCDFEVEHGVPDGATEPPGAVRGDVARAWLYMADQYPDRLPLTADERRMFERWSEADPVDAWERERDARIARIQGNHNPFVAGR